MPAGPCPNCKARMTISDSATSVTCNDCGTEYQVIRDRGKIRLRRVRKTDVGNISASRKSRTPAQAGSKITTVAELDALINLGGATGSGASLINSELLSDDMKKALAMYSSGTEAMERGRRAEAVLVFRQTLTYWPNFVAARVNLANCLTALGQPQDALRELSYALQLAPDDTDIHLSAGVAYGAIGNKQKEIDEYHKALWIRTGNIVILNKKAMINLGAAYLEIGQPQQAQEWLFKVLEEVRNDESFSAHLGMESSRTNPYKSSILPMLALSFEMLGDWEHAVKYWQECLSLDPSDPQLRERLQAAKANTENVHKLDRRSSQKDTFLTREEMWEASREVSQLLSEAQGTTERTTKGGQEEHPAYKAGFQDGYEQGWEEGWEEGHEQGHEEGIDEGRESGYADGYAKGYEDGYEEGHEQGMYDVGELL